jgi:hypothetical protein
MNLTTILVVAAAGLGGALLAKRFGTNAPAIAAAGTAAAIILARGFTN